MFRNNRLELSAVFILLLCLGACSDGDSTSSGPIDSDDGTTAQADSVEESTEGGESDSCTGEFCDSPQCPRTKIALPC